MSNKSIEVHLREINGQWPYPEGLVGSEHFVQIIGIDKYEQSIIGKGEKAVDGTLITLKSGDTIGLSDGYTSIVSQLEEVSTAV